MRPVPQCAFDFVAREEGCVLRVYDDARPAYVLQPGDKPKGTLTAGRGHTGFLSVGLPVSQAMADTWTRNDLNVAAGLLEKRIGEVIADLTDNQYAALLSFVFNCGDGDPEKAEWTIWKVLRAKQFDQVPPQLARFVNGEVGGKTVKIKGLVNRRNAEIALWSTAEPGSVEDDLPSSVTRKIATPPTSSDPTPVTKSAPIVSGAVAAVASVPVAYSQVSAALAPVAAQHPTHASLFASLAILGAVCAGVAVLLAYLHKQNSRT